MPLWTFTDPKNISSPTFESLLGMLFDLFFSLVMQVRIFLINLKQKLLCKKCIQCGSAPPIKVINMYKGLQNWLHILYKAY